MAKAKGGLGRGLGALLPEYDEMLNGKNSEGVVELELEDLFPNPEQPRKIFDEDQLTDLAESIREHGVLQPAIVTPRGDKYMIVAGERRWRACKQAGLSTIPALIRELDDDKIMEMALIENVQRADLTPIEEARAYQTLQNRFGYTHELLSKRMGKSRSVISNSLRLLSLPEDVQEMVQDGKLSVGHVRPLLSVNVPEWQSSFAHEIYQSDLSARDVERMVKKVLSRGQIEDVKVLYRNPDLSDHRKLPDELLTLQEQLAERLSTKVNIKQNRTGGGRLILEYYSDDDLKRIFDALSGEFY